MKAIFISILTIFLIQAIKAAEKYALIIGISEYAPGTGWNKLSAEADIQLMEGALKSQGFNSANILIIRNSGATKKGILNGIREWLLKKVNAGDMAVFHFSGHGQQIFDDNGDEADGYDEALVPYDASSTFKKGEEHHLRDDELGSALSEVRGKLGISGHLLVLIDACHSGTGIRSMANHRGTLNKITNGQDDPGNHSKRPETSFGLVENSRDLSPVVCFYASSADELNYEAFQNGKRSGSLTLAFVKSLLSMTSERSYRSLFENIQREMSALAPAQNPQAEGMLDMGIFNGVRLRNTNHYSVIERISQQELTISFGKLLGSSIGSKVKFYPPDTRDTSKIRPTLIGTIVQSSELSSIVRLSGIATESAIKSSWIYPEQINYGEIRTRVNCSDLLKTKLAEILNGVELVDVDEDIRIVENRGEPKFSFINRCGEVFRQCEEEELKTSLPLIINDFGRANYLRTLNLNSDGLNIGMELIHLKSSYENSKKSVDDSSGFITLRENDTIRFRFSGKLLTKRAYFTIIDIQPDNQIRVVFPQDGQTPAEFFLEPGEVKEPGSSYIIGPPFGKEIFQVIASERPIDLRNYFDRTVSKNLLPTHPFEKLIQSASAIQYSKSKGIKLGAGAPGMVNISSMLVNIVPTNYNP